jgi:hypothetical protein
MKKLIIFVSLMIGSYLAANDLTATLKTDELIQLRPELRLESQTETEHALNLDIRKDLRKLKAVEKGVDKTIRTILFLPDSVKLRSQMRPGNVRSHLEYNF